MNMLWHTQKKAEILYSFLYPNIPYTIDWIGEENLGCETEFAYCGRLPSASTDIEWGLFPE